MVTLNLDKIFKPKSIAVVGASDEEGTVGYALVKNLIDLKFEGRILPVNIRKTQILGYKAYSSVGQIPDPVDLAVIATPAHTVPDVEEERAFLIMPISMSLFYTTSSRSIEPQANNTFLLDRKFNFAHTDSCPYRQI